MSIQIRTVLAFIGVITLICAVNFAVSWFFTQLSVNETTEKELSLARDIVDELVSKEINLLKSSARTVAARLDVVPDENLLDAMREQIKTDSLFLGFSVFDRDSLVASWGRFPTPAERLQQSRYLDLAFAGESVISTTRLAPSRGEMVMHVCVPMQNDRVLSVTIPGLLFSDLLSQFRLWKTGSIYMIDEDGKMIAARRREQVLHQNNYIEIAKNRPEVKDIGDFFRKMISRNEGTGIYQFEGVRTFCTWRRINATTSGWTIAVAAPLAESPTRHIFYDLLISAVVILSSGIAIVLVLSKFLADPYYQIAEQKKNLELLNRSLEESNETARTASAAKTNFLANMSHEMRTPLNAIVGLSGLSLDSGEARGETLENLEKIYSAGMTLLGTVNDILDISKIEAGKFDIVPVEYDVPSLINDTVMQNIMRIGEKPVKFTLTVDGSLPARLFGDDLRIKQILNNLLSNAFKYTQEGTVDLAVFCLREGDVCWFSARVKDTGIGIKKEYINRLFSDYSQVDVRANRMIEGTGLGLAITKRMTELMGGTITVESEFGKGSAFTVSLKQGFVSDQTIGDSTAESLGMLMHFKNKQSRNTKFARIRLPYARVLVVDDVSTNLDVVRGMMKPYQLQVDCVMSGQAAIDRIREGSPVYDAIFMDHMMPGMDGIEAAHIIHEEIDTDYAKNILIIALTANAIRGNAEMFLENGFRDFLSKPIDIQQLDAVLRRWIRDKEKEAALHIDEPPPENAGNDPADGFFYTHAIDGMDAKKALARFGGDEEALLTVLRSFVDNTPALTGKLREETDLADYAITVHGLKGACRGICAEECGNAAEALEHAAKAEDAAFVRAHTGPFAGEVEALVSRIAGLLSLRQEKGLRQVKNAPDLDVLARLREACAAFDLDGAETELAELERFDYLSGNELPAWIREKLTVMAFREIAAGLEAAAVSTP